MRSVHITDYPLQESEMSLFAMHAPVLVWSTTACGNIEHLSAFWREYCGEDGTRVVDDHTFFHEAVHGEDFAALSRRIEGSPESDRIAAADLRIRRQGEGYRWHSVSGTSVRASDGSRRRIFSAIDTHENRVLLDVLQENERDYREIVESLPQIVWTATADGDIDYFNDYFYDFTGLTPQAALGAGWRRLAPPEDLEATDAAWTRALRTGDPFVHEERIRRHDGVYRRNLTTARPLRTASGEIRRWVGVTTDIDDQKRVEHHLRMLDDAGDILASSLDAHVNARRVAEMIVSEMSDWCGISLIDDDDELTQLVVAHRDPAQALAGMNYCRRYPSRPGGVNDRVARSGKSLLLPSVSSEHISAAAIDGDHKRLLMALDLRSAIIVPLALRGRLYGTLQVFNGRDGRPFTDADLQIVELIGKRLALAIDNSRIYERERRVADTFQRAALPASLPQVDGASLAAVYLPAQSDAEVGGDWYDAFRLDEHHLVISIGDVAGKGLEAAVLMAGVRQSLRVAAYQRLLPDAILAVADAALKAEHPEHFVTSFVGIIDTRDWTMDYASAGHPPGLVRHQNGSIEELTCGSPPLGLLDVPPSLRTIRLPRHALLLLYTDGVIESTRDLHEGERRIRAVVSTDAILRVNNPAEFVRELVLHDGARDDIAILSLHIDARRHWTFDAGDAIAAHGARSSFVAALRSHATPDSQLEAAELIFGELVGNVVRHAPGPIDIDLTWDEVSPVLHVLDRGRGFAEEDVPPHDLVRESGRGLFIVRSMSSDVRIRSLPGRGTHVSVVLPVSRLEASM